MSADRTPMDVHAPFAAGNWVAEAPEFDRPKIAKVKDIYFDRIANEWVADLILYSAGGDRIGRESPACGGPRTFEPCVPVATWRAIKKPSFPLDRDRTGYRDWKCALLYVEPHIGQGAANHG